MEITRQVIKVGDKLMVSLPKEWAAQYRLGKGSQVDMVVIPEGCCILPPHREEQ